MPSPSAPLRPGDQLGPYRIVRQLGSGGMGTVFEAVDVGLGRHVALKVIAPALAGDPLFRERFAREAQAQAALDSAHVVTVYAYGEVEGRLYIASQLIPDGDLGAMFRAHGAPPPRIAVSLLAQVADGLAEAHRVGLVHRDIKPANVLLRNRGDSVSAYLADFGIARRVDGRGVSGLTTEGFAVGTPSYMAPELHTGGTAGPASDIYSLGCLLWACLTGRAPYGGTTDYQVVSAHVSAPVPQLAGAGPFEREINRILARALAKDPAQRYPSATQLRDDLRSVERTLAAPAEVGVGAPGRGPAGHAVPGGPTPPLGYGAPPARGGGSRTALVVAGVVTAVALVAGGVALAVTQTGGPDPDPVAGPASGDAGTTGTDAGTDASGDTATTEVSVSEDPDLSDDENAAIANLAAALASDGDIDDRTAECVARQLVEKRGIEDLQEAGFIDEDLQVETEGSGAPDAGLLADVFTLAFDCVMETAGSG